MADLVNTSGFRSSQAASSAPRLDVAPIDYDAINKGFAQGWAEGKQLLADLDEFEVRPQKKDLLKQSIAAKSADTQREQDVLNGVTPAVRQEGNFDVSTLSGQATHRTPPKQESITVQKPDGSLVQQRSLVDPYTGERKALDEIEIMPAPAKAPAAESMPPEEIDPLYFSEYGNSPAGAPASAGGVTPKLSVGPGGVRMTYGAAASRSTGTAGSPDNYLKAADNDRMKEFAAASDQAQVLKTELNDFATLNAKTYTGPVSKVPGVNAVRSLVNADVATLDAYNLNFAKLARQGFPGAVSNKEMAMYKSSVPSTVNPKETNVALIAAMLPAVERAQQKNSIAREWVDKHGSLTGFEDQWNQYLEEVPVVNKEILDKAKTDPNAALNELGNRPPALTFKQYLGMKRAGVVPEEQLQDMSEKLAVVRKTNPQYGDEAVAAKAVEKTLLKRFPFLGKAADPRDPLSKVRGQNLTQAVGQILNGSSGSLDDAVDQGTGAASTPAPAAGGKTVAEALSTRNSVQTGQDTPLPKSLGGIARAGEESNAEWAKQLGMPAELFKQNDTRGGVKKLLGMPNRGGQTTELNPDTVKWFEDNREAIANDPKLAANLNQYLRASVARYTPVAARSENGRSVPYHRELDEFATHRASIPVKALILKLALPNVLAAPDVEPANGGEVVSVDPLSAIPIGSVVASR